MLIYRNVVTPNRKLGSSVQRYYFKLPLMRNYRRGLSFVNERFLKLTVKTRYLLFIFMPPILRDKYKVSYET